MAYYRKLYDRDELPSRAKLVYIYLYDRCDAERKAWPSNKGLGKSGAYSQGICQAKKRLVHKQPLFFTVIRQGIGLLTMCQ